MTTDPAELIHLLTRIKDHYTAAIHFHTIALPQSAALEELAATRLINRRILELQAKPTSHRQPSKKL